MIYLTGAKNNSCTHFYDNGTLGVLNTPSVGYKLHPQWIWAADNGCFNATTYVGDTKWFTWLQKQPTHRCLFATAPDVVGNHVETLTRSLPWLKQIRDLGFQVAFVLQNGSTTDTIPWHEFDVAFIGGDNSWKLGGADHLIIEAKQRGKKVHVGRVNSGKRFERFALMGVDSVDGTHLAFAPDRNLASLLSWIRKEETHQPLWTVEYA